ncbi:MAG: hypothetical protein ACTTJI_03810 [Capnocytophaga sp.]|uniref:hypothetical protein n=1 Tax=Capnocytophaga sp. TaxID=44737 RepID=UPI003FA04800
MLDDKQQRILDTIAQVGALTPLAIAKTAHQYPRIRDLNQEEVAPTFGLLFTRIAALVGVKGQIDPLQKQEIWNVVFSRFSGLSFQELYKAFQMDRSGEIDTVTDHFQFFDVSYVSTVLNKYIEWKRKTQIEHNISISEKATEKMITEEEKEFRTRRWLISGFQEYKDTGALPVLAVPLYDALYTLGMLTPYYATYTDEKRATMLEAATERAKNQMNATENRKEYALLKALYQTMKSGVQDAEGKILSIKKEVALQDYYDWTIAQGIDLITELTNLSMKKLIKN